MGAGLSKQLVPMFVGGGIDTKTDPRLVQAGSLLELENMFMLRTGELRFRNGYTSLVKNWTGNGTVVSPRALFRTPSGAIGMISDAGAELRKFLKYTTGSRLQWNSGGYLDEVPLPLVTCALTGIAGFQLGQPPISLSDLVDCDSCTGNGQTLTAWTEQGGVGEISYNITDAANGAILTASQLLPGTVVGRRAKTCFSRSKLCLFYLDNSATPSLNVLSYNSVGSAATATIVLNGVSAANPYFDIRTDPVSGNVFVAYRSSAGGVSCLIYSPFTNSVTTGPVNTAGADATLAIGWLDNPSAIGGAAILATAGTVSGVVARVIDQSTLAVTATNVIDASATASIRNITGHINTGTSDYLVLWDVDATPTHNMTVKRGVWSGSSAVTSYAGSFGLASRTFIASDGLNYFVASYDSPVQATYCLVASQNTLVFTSQCNAMLGVAGGRTVASNSLSSPWLSSVGKYACALMKKTKVTAANGSFLSSRSICAARFDFLSTSSRVRELGSTMFAPGGVPIKHDGGSTTWSVIPFAPEAPTLASSATGSMTPGGQYDYFNVYKLTDVSGRILRSAPSVSTTITLGVGDGRVTASAKTLRQQPAFLTNVIIETYRRGPNGSGALTINKVGEVTENAISAANTTDFIDSISDVAAASGELLYTTNGILENFPAPSHNLLEVNAGRVWVVNAEDPTELWPSKEYKPGLGVGFHSLLAFRVTGDGFGGITALASMDGRLIVFKSSAIYVITGDGPNDAGVGSFNPPQCVSLNVGTVLPGSVVATPDGIMFQSAKGIYLLSRGLTLTYAGKSVEKYTLAENVVDASLVDNATQVRFVQASGRCLVWDYDAQKWYTFKFPVGSSTIVACANIQSGWCYALADGTVKQEVQGQYSDDGVAIVPRIGFPQMNLAGINGYQRVYGVQVEGEYVGDHVLKCDVVYDLGAAVEPQRTRVITSGPYQYEILLASPKCSTVQVTLSCSLAAGSGGFRLSAASLLVGVKRGTGIPYGKRLT